MPREIDIHMGAAPGDADAITQGLVAFNVSAGGIAPPEHITLLLKSEDGQHIDGGLRARLSGQWLIVDQLWIADVARGDGDGARLIAKAEQVAIARGCVGAHLDSFDFQAPGFYERLGYVAFGKIEDHPPGHSRIFFQKRFRAS